MVAREDAPALASQPSRDGRPPLEDQTRHLHCGYWEAPAQADRAGEDFALATEEMCRRLFRAAAVADGMRILDAGCGTGGTIEALGTAFGSLSLTGLNIDPLELAAARRRLRGRARPAGDTRDIGDVELIEGDACAMPLPDGGFDLVLAIESILLFPSRRRFLSEARRVLRPGGRLLVVDFVPAPALRAWLGAWRGSLGRLRAPRGPRTDVRISLAAYRRLAAATGFRLERAEDWTRQTLPSYRAGRRVVRRLGGRLSASALVSNTLTEWVSRAGLLRYQVLVFQDLREPAP